MYRLRPARRERLRSRRSVFLSLAPAVALAAFASLSGCADNSTEPTPTPKPQPQSTPPRVVSTSPSDLSTGVMNLDSFSITFSKAIDPSSPVIYFYPSKYFKITTWSDDGKTMTTRLSLQPDQQYYVMLMPGTFRDMHGVSNVEPAAIHFTTGPAVSSGSISGTIAGDPYSDFAKDPEGAVAVALKGPVTGLQYMLIGGLSPVDQPGSYYVKHLEDRNYLLVAFMDSNHDGTIDINTGDAFGIVNMDFRNQIFANSIVPVMNGGAVTGQDFKLVDPSAISGTVSYAGTIDTWFLVIGLYNVDGFDPSGPPDYALAPEWYGNDTPYSIFDIFDGFPAGTYYVSAFLDRDGDRMYNPSDDPLGFYGGDSPIPVTLSRGSDAQNVSITLNPPLPGAAAPVAWPVHERSAAVTQALRLAERACNAGGPEPQQTTP